MFLKLLASTLLVVGLESGGAPRSLLLVAHAVSMLLLLQTCADVQEEAEEEERVEEQRKRWEMIQRLNAQEAKDGAPASGTTAAAAAGGGTGTGSTSAAGANAASTADTGNQHDGTSIV